MLNETMLEEHKNRIDFCQNEIVPKIDLTKLLPKLIEYKVYDRDDSNMDRWLNTLTKQETVADVYDTIKTRGPHAFYNFQLSLRETGYEDLADLLQGNNNNKIYDMYTNSDSDDNFYRNIQEANSVLEIKVKKATQFKDTPTNWDNIEKYPMRSNPRGLVLNISNINFEYLRSRDSAVHDEKNLNALFEQMGFKVILRHNLRSKDMLKAVQKFSQLEELRKVDSAFIIITSHGRYSKSRNEPEIQGIDHTGCDTDDEQSNQDDESIPYSKIYDCFTAKACPNLADKPKVFIFQACRGKAEQQAVKKPRHTTDAGECEFQQEKPYVHLDTVRNYSDTFVVHSTLPGNVSFRDKQIGSWFIQIFCEVFMNHAHEKHLVDLVTMVDQRIESQRTFAKSSCQTIHCESIGFKKHMYLNPGLFEDDQNDDKF